MEPLKEEAENLLNTIKMPRQMTQISRVMPASQYGGGSNNQVKESGRDLRKLIQNNLPQSNESDRTRVRAEPPKRSNSSNDQPSSSAAIQSAAEVKRLQNRANRNQNLAVIEESGEEGGQTGMKGA